MKKFLKGTWLFLAISCAIIATEIVIGWRMPTQTTIDLEKANVFLWHLTVQIGILGTVVILLGFWMIRKLQRGERCQ